MSDITITKISVGTFLKSIVSFITSVITETINDNTPMIRNPKEMIVLKFSNNKDHPL